MLKMINCNKGISLISLAIAIMVMMIITGVVIYQSTTSVELRNINNMYNDLRLLEENVNVFYSKYGGLPAFTDINMFASVKDLDLNPNDDADYYELDIAALGNLTLNYGNKKNGNQGDVYAINNRTHTIYYVQGIALSGIIYHKLPGSYGEVDLSHAETIVKGYVKDGLILHYDGINNTGKGDIYHSNNATIWKDLSSNGNDTIGYYSPAWDSNSFIGNDNDSGFLLPDSISDAIFDKYFTLEFVLKADVVAGRDTLFGNYNLAHSFNIERNSSAFSDSSSRFYWDSSNPDIKLVNAKTGTEKTSLAITVNNNTVISYIDGQVKDNITQTLSSIRPTSIYLGRDTRTGTTVFGGHMYAVRIYNKVLTGAEIQQNYDFDKIRFEMP